MPYNFMQAYNPYAYQPQQSGMLWVSNEQEAFSYPVAPNNAVALWDSGKPTVYVKQADASGKPFIKILDYTERSPSSSASNNMDTYASKSDIDKILIEIESIKAKLKGAPNE